jgi:tetratricopeptide (TPR) repeat protein
MGKKRSNGLGNNQARAMVQEMARLLQETPEDQLPELVARLQQELALDRLDAPQGIVRPDPARGKPKAKVPKGNTPWSQAIDVVSEACQNGEINRQLLHRALEIDPECAPALWLLAQCAAEDEAEQREAWLRKAIEACQSISQGDFSRFEGRLTPESLQDLEVEVRHTLSSDLQGKVKLEEALETLLPILYEDDCFFVRTALMALYIKLDRQAEARDLAERFPDNDEMPAWYYATALVAFRDGDLKAANARLKLALHEFPSIAAALFEPSDEDDPRLLDTVCYLRSLLICSPGAMAWMRRAYARMLPADEEADDMPWDNVSYKPENYAVGNARWMIAFRPGDRPHLGALIVCDAESLAPVDVAPGAKHPTPAQWLKYLTRTVVERTPDKEWPSTIYVRDAALQKKLQDKLKKCKVRCESGGNWKDFDRLANDFARVMRGAEQKPLEPPNIARLRALPVSDWPWFVAVRKTSEWLQNDGEFTRFSTLVIFSESGVVGTQILPGDSPGDALPAAVARTMEHPAAGSPCRPAVVLTDDEEVERLLAPLLKSLELPSQVEALPPDISEALDTLPQPSRNGEGPVAVVRAPGATEELLAAFFAAAAEYFRARPWNRVRGDRRILVTTPGLSVRERDAIVMGQNGEVFGLSLTEDRAALFDALEGIDESHDFRLQTGLSVSFEEAHFAAVEDYDAMRDHHWPVAAPEAYPMVTHYEKGTLRGALAWEVDLLAAVLQRIVRLIDMPDDAVIRERTPLGQELILQWQDPA